MNCFLSTKLLASYTRWKSWEWRKQLLLTDCMPWERFRRMKSGCHMRWDKRTKMTIQAKCWKRDQRHTNVIALGSSMAPSRYPWHCPFWLLLTQIGTAWLRKYTHSRCRREKYGLINGSIKEKNAHHSLTRAVYKMTWINRKLRPILWWLKLYAFFEDKAKKSQKILDYLFIPLIFSKGKARSVHEISS